MAAGAQKTRLGRGLASLIGDRFDEAGLGLEEEQRTVPLAVLKPGRFNPRRNFAEAQLEELAVSIRERGLVQPLVVRPSSGDTYEIVAGERRWRAAQLANLHDVPVIVRALSDQVVEDVRRVLGEKVYTTIIPRNVRVAESPSHGKPVLLYDYRCSGSQAYIQLASEVIERERRMRAA